MAGLIGKFEFEDNYLYYYGNASRSLPSEEDVSRSVQIVGRNASAKQISLMVFVSFKRNMIVDIQTGEGNMKGKKNQIRYMKGKIFASLHPRIIRHPV